MEREKWITSITNHDNEGNLIIRGKKLNDLIEDYSFTKAIFLLLLGKDPTLSEEKLFNSLLIASMDHGIEAPSTTIARISASNGVPTPGAIANGIGAVGERHGGAVEAAMKVFSENLEKSAPEIVNDFKSRGKRLPGFGHKIYKEDPRTQKLLEIAKQTNHDGEFVKLAIEIEKELEKISGKKLPLNIDGITAALLCELGFDPKLGNSLFIISRVTGIATHVFEEQTTNKSVRRISEEDIEFHEAS